MFARILIGAKFCWCASTSANSCGRNAGATVHGSGGLSDPRKTHAVRISIDDISRLGEG